MARTRVDPWQMEQPEYFWKSLPPSNYEKKLVTNPYKIQSLPNPYFSLPKGTSHSSFYSISKSNPFASSKKLISKPSKQPSELIYRPSSKVHRSKSDLKSVGSKVLAAVNGSSANAYELSTQKSSVSLQNAYEVSTPKSSVSLQNAYEVSPPKSSFSLQRRLKPKKRKPHDLYEADTRLKMVPKVILKDIGEIISKVCPKLKATTPTKSNDSAKGLIKVTGLKILLPVKTTTNSKSPSEFNLAIESVVGSVKSCADIPEIILDPPEVLTKPPGVHLQPPEVILDPPEVILDPPEVILDPPEVILDPPEVVPKPQAIVLDSSSITRPDPPVVTLFDLSEDAETPISKVTRCPSKDSKSNASCVENTVSHSPEIQQFKKASAAVPCRPLPYPKIGFLGFPEEVGGRLKKTRYHVNTNILASSLDLLDLHKNNGMSSGSPLDCTHCGVIFSSVKHCKFHQSVSTSDVSADPSRFNNVKGDNMWLCPWCPVLCINLDYLEMHKASCREKGRCQQNQRDSSLRKGASNNLRRITTSNSVSSAAAAEKSLKSYKVVHGHVIPVISV